LIGIADYGTRFLDSYAVLATLDAMRAGHDPHAANSLDPLLRYHVYSDWWLALKWTGLGRAQNMFVGVAWVAAFGATAWATARPKSWRESCWLAAVLVSPPVLLAVVRANNDLELYDLVNDPDEVVNLAHDFERNRDLIAIMNAKLNTLIEREICVDDGRFMHLDAWIDWKDAMPTAVNL
jgi:hypothetical protein